jgi:hypothetical protein
MKLSGTRSTIEWILCIRQALKKKWDCSETVHQLFIDFKKAYGLVRREVLYNILIQLGVPKKIVRFIKMCFNEIYVKSI